MSLEDTTSEGTSSDGKGADYVQGLLFARKTQVLHSIFTDYGSVDMLLAFLDAYCVEVFTPKFMHLLQKLVRVRAALLTGMSQPTVPISCTQKANKAT